ncbi:MAG: chemotaxis protein CheW [Oscillatoria sp. PMC 1051.18]|nr:chemotaxis protein CheW [Oscillatoria sp. PMC 1050.18]MEC5029112.1 chemotaxis protein CheW [Oscillatoria sp. PMC 1051.18]
MTETHQFCTFYLAHLFLGLEVNKVQEVIRYQSITRVPLAPPAVRGLINLRGQIIPAIDLRKCLDLSASQSVAERKKSKSESFAKASALIDFFPQTEQLPLNVVMQADDEIFSLLVDEVGEVLEISDRYFEYPPEILKGEARELICGAYKLADKLLLILDINKVIEVAKASQKVRKKHEK